jgi:hypothetical protein
VRTTPEVIDWYRSHETKAELGFDPDGMCMKIVRTARGLPAMFPSALASQLATPEKNRIFSAADIRPGMVGYYDDPRDTNPFGHVVTYMAVVKDEDPSVLRSWLCRTNSVVSGKIVVVRGDYFPRHWGDDFQFASDWLNGEKLPVKASKKKPLGQAESLQKALKLIDKSIQHHEKMGHERLVTALLRDREQLEKTIKKFSQKKK